MSNLRQPGVLRVLVKGRLLVTIATVVASLLLAVGGGQVRAAGTTYYVNGATGNDANPCTSISTPCQTIQAAVGYASNGDTINVAAGTYTEQVTISKSVTLRGAGASGTTIKAPTTLTPDARGQTAILEISGLVTVSLSDLTVSGPGPSDCGSLMYGIYVIGGATLNLSAATISDIRDTPLSGCQNGVGIRVGDGPFGQVGHGTITGVTVVSYQKSGIEVDGAGSTATITSSSVTWNGPRPSPIAPNGFQIGDGAVVQASGNTVSGNVCDVPNGCGPDLINEYQGFAILLYQAGAGTSITSNSVSGNDMGIYNLSSGGATTAISGNTLTSNRYGGIFLDQGDATVSNNTVTGGNVGVAIISYAGSAANSQGTLTGNTISGTSQAGMFLVDQDPTDAFTPSLTAQSNILSGNAAGLDNTATVAVDATQNWWGQPSGPTLSANPGGTGDTITGNVSFSPWCATSACTSFNGVATRLVFATQPADAVAGATFGTQPVVRAEDASGNLGYNFNGAVSLALGENPAGGTLTGTTTVNAVNGVATFSGLTIDLAGVGYTLVASATVPTASPAAQTATSAQFNVAALPPPMPPTSNWESQGGLLGDSPGAVGFNGEVCVFAKGADNALYIKCSPLSTSGAVSLATTTW